MQGVKINIPLIQSGYVRARNIFPYRIHCCMVFALSIYRREKGSLKQYGSTPAERDSNCHDFAPDGISNIPKGAEIIK